MMRNCIGYDTEKSWIQGVVAYRQMPSQEYNYLAAILNLDEEEESLGDSFRGFDKTARDYTSVDRKGNSLNYPFLNTSGLIKDSGLFKPLNQRAGNHEFMPEEFWPPPHDLAEPNREEQETTIKLPPGLGPPESTHLNQDDFRSFQEQQGNNTMDANSTNINQSNFGFSDYFYREEPDKLINLQPNNAHFDENKPFWAGIPNHSAIQDSATDPKKRRLSKELLSSDTKLSEKDINWPDSLQRDPFTNFEDTKVKEQHSQKSETNKIIYHRTKETAQNPADLFNNQKFKSSYPISKPQDNLWLNPQSNIHSHFEYDSYKDQQRIQKTNINQEKHKSSINHRNIHQKQQSNHHNFEKLKREYHMKAPIIEESRKSTAPLDPYSHKDNITKKQQPKGNRKFKLDPLTSPSGSDEEKRDKISEAQVTLDPFIQIKPNLISKKEATKGNVSNSEKIKSKLHQPANKFDVLSNFLSSEKQNSKTPEGSPEEDNKDAAEQTDDKSQKQIASKKNKKKKKNKKDKAAIKEPESEEIPEEIVLENDDLDKEVVTNVAKESKEEIIGDINKNEEEIDKKEKEVTANTETEVVQDQHINKNETTPQEEIPKELANKSAKKKKNKSKKKKEDNMNPATSTKPPVQLNRVLNKIVEADFELSIYPEKDDPDKIKAENDISVFSAALAHNREPEIAMQFGDMQHSGDYLGDGWNLDCSNLIFEGADITPSEKVDDPEKTKIIENKINSNSKKKSKNTNGEAVLDKKNAPEPKDEEVKFAPRIISSEKNAVSNGQNLNSSNLLNQTKNMAVATNNENPMLRKVHKRGGRKHNKKKNKKSEDSPEADKEILGEFSIDDDNFANVRTGDF